MFPHFDQPLWLLALLIVAAAAGLFVMSERTRKLAILQFLGVSAEVAERLRDRRFDVGCLLVAMALVVLALARPAWRQIPEDVASEGRDLVFLLDVSRSMLASDLQPNRLETAKAAIRDCVKDLQNDRVGLVAFAGSSSILCPLTTDYTFFQDKLTEASPEIVDQGGTRIGDALRKTSDKLLSKDRRGLQDVILLSDGGDQESNPDAAVEELTELGVYFVVIGIGDARTGARVPTRVETGQEPSFAMHDGREVWSKLEARGLDKLARSCRHGVFLNAGTRALPLGDIYAKLVKHFRRQYVNEKDEEMMRWEQTFPFFLAAALALLAPPFVRWGWGRASPAASLAIFAIVLGIVPNARAENPVKLFNYGHTQIEATNFGGAIQTFMLAAEKFEDPQSRLQAIYNAGYASFREAEKTLAIEPGTDYEAAYHYYEVAAEAFRSCVRADPGYADAAWSLEVTLRHLVETAEKVENQSESDEDAPMDEGDPQDGEAEESSEDESEGEMEEAEGEGESEPSDQNAGENAMDMDAQDIPPPMVEPEDIFDQEAANAETREKNAGSKYKAVEKDW